MRSLSGKIEAFRYCSISTIFNLKLLIVINNSVTEYLIPIAACSELRTFQGWLRRGSDKAVLMAQEGVYRYRLTAWNAYGWSDEALSSECILSSASHACKACELDGSCNQSAFVHDREGKEHGWLGTHSGRGAHAMHLP